MRWCVSIGVVFAAGVIAGGDVPGLAAPSAPSSPVAAEAKVDVELILAVDVSYSMDMDELALQREGYALAVTSREFLGAQDRPHRQGRGDSEWAASSDQKIVVPWRVIDGPESAGALAEEILKAPLRRASRTSISGAINFAMPLFEANEYQGLRRVIDISGDGPNDNGEPVTIARDAALAKGITINGLPIMSKETNYATMDIENLDIYYEDCVIGGAGSFVVPIKTKEKFKEAIRTKLVMEVAHRVPEPRVVPVAAREPRVSCTMARRSGRSDGEGSYRLNLATSSTCGVWRN